MSNDRFDISRRKALTALGTIGAASAGAGLGTSAYFSDQETFENNSLVAGTLDVGVGYSAHYSDWSSDEDDGLEGDVRMPEGQVGTADELDPDEVGLPANDAWLIAVEDVADAEQFLDNTEYQSFNDGTLDCIGGEANSQADDEDRPVVDLDDVKPGDFGEVTFDFIICDNPGFVWLDGTLRSASENGLTEPEADDPDEGEGVELLDVVQAAVWIDDGGDGPGGNEDGNNYQNGTEEPLVVGSIAEVLGMLGESNLGAALNGNIPAEEGGGAVDARNCFSANTVHSLVFAWWVPVDHGNEIQSDSATFDLGLYAEQCRHNDGSGMNNEPVDDGDDGPVSTGQFEAVLPDGSTIPFDAVENDESVGSFYAYGSRQASSDTGLEIADESIAFVYRNTNDGNLSLVFIHDDANDGSGGSAAFGLSGTGYGNWVVTDGEGGDSFGSGSASWGWNSCCTDGGALDVASTFSVTVDPSFSGINRWVVVDSDGSVTDLGTLTDPVTFRSA